MNHFIDGKDELGRNWMCYVQCARSDQEQNLEIVQHANEKIFYYALKDIPPNQELLVWYGSNVDMFLGIPQHRLHFPSKLHQVLPEDWSEYQPNYQASFIYLVYNLCKRPEYYDYIFIRISKF